MIKLDDTRHKGSMSFTVKKRKTDKLGWRHFIIYYSHADFVYLSILILVIFVPVNN